MERSVTLTEIRLESVSMGKGLVHWRVILPPFRRRPRTLKKEYVQLEDACRAVREHFSRDDVSPATANLVEEYAPGSGWGAAGKHERTTSAE